MMTLFLMAAAEGKVQERRHCHDLLHILRIHANMARIGRFKGQYGPQIKAIYLRQLPMGPISDPD